MRLATILITTAAMLFAAGSALANTGCLQPRHVETFKVLDGKTLIIRQGPNDEYKLTLAIKCQDLDFAPTIGVKQLTPTMCLTTGDSVVYSHGGISQSCIISKVEPYTAPKASEPAATPAPALTGY
jgi:hypothetical protein